MSWIGNGIYTECENSCHKIDAGQKTGLSCAFEFSIRLSVSVKTLKPIMLGFYNKYVWSSVLWMATIIIM